MTTLEFKGLKPFEKPYCKLEGSPSDLDSLRNSTIKSNFRLAVVVCEIKNMNGDIIFNKPYMLNGNDVGDGIGDNFPLKTYLTYRLFKDLKAKSKNCTVKLMVTLSNGKDYTLLDSVKM